MGIEWQQGFSSWVHLLTLELVERKGQHKVQNCRKGFTLYFACRPNFNCKTRRLQSFFFAGARKTKIMCSAISHAQQILRIPTLRTKLIDINRFIKTSGGESIMKMLVSVQLKKRRVIKFSSQNPEILDIKHFFQHRVSLRNVIPSPK
jgi:hypothetical protein